MRFALAPGWKEAATAIADSHFKEYIRLAALLTVAEARGIEDKPIASVDMTHGVFQFETRRLCALAIQPHSGEPTLTHIFVRGGPAAITGRRNRAVAAARAIGLTPFLIP